MFLIDAKFVVLHDVQGATAPPRCGPDVYRHRVDVPRDTRMRMNGTLTTVSAECSHERIWIIVNSDPISVQKYRGLLPSIERGTFGEVSNTILLHQFLDV